jgi:hypothetical protein
MAGATLQTLLAIYQRPKGLCEVKQTTDWQIHKKNRERFI